ncbi:MAG: hypothetical protein HRU80_03485 [Ignavibacteriales bacterium]|nr:MAG: hypothetical protein HRU80_03485 [Ignavibacteriales bacterium]
MRQILSSGAGVGGDDDGGAQKQRGASRTANRFYYWFVLKLFSFLQSKLNSPADEIQNIF